MQRIVLYLEQRFALEVHVASRAAESLGETDLAREAELHRASVAECQRRPLTSRGRHLLHHRRDGLLRAPRLHHVPRRERTRSGEKDHRCGTRPHDLATPHTPRRECCDAKLNPPASRLPPPASRHRSPPRRVPALELLPRAIHIDARIFLT